MRKFLAFLATLIACFLLLPNDSAHARGGGMRGGGAGRLGGGGRGGGKKKDKKLQQARRDRENREGFLRDAADDAR